MMCSITRSARVLCVATSMVAMVAFTAVVLAESTCWRQTQGENSCTRVIEEEHDPTLWIRA